MVTKEFDIFSDDSKRLLLRFYHSNVLAGNRMYREHYHAEFEISVIKSGSGVYKVNNKAYEFRSGDVFIFSGNETHCMTRVDKNETLDLVSIKFEPRFIWSAGNEIFDAKYLKIFLSRNESFENRLDRANPANSEISVLFDEIENEFETKRTEYELMVKINLLRILVTAIRSYGYVDNSYKVHKRSLYSLEKAMDYIDKNLTADLSLDELAENANMSRTYFCTIFKKLNGISPWDYITIRRIEKAMNILKSTDCTMLETAIKCGFNSTANFNRAFKKVTGIVPSEYKMNF